MAFFAITSFQATNADAAVMHYLQCSEVDAPMFDAIVVNIDRFMSPEMNTKASVYHRMEQNTVLVARVDVIERQARRPGAPKEFVGEGFHLEVQTTVAPSPKGFPARLKLKLENHHLDFEMSCSFVR